MTEINGKYNTAIYKYASSKNELVHTKMEKRKEKKKK
jgi:hypothetical protein